MERPNRLLATALLACALPAATEAADWYPASCHDIDRCARVDAVNWRVPAGGGAPRLVVSAAGVTAEVRRAFVTAEAPDGALHVCMRYDPFGDLEVTCLMVPHLGY